MTKFKKIDPVAYTQEREDQIQTYAKYGTVMVRKAVPGEEITTLTKGEGDEKFVETKNTAKEGQVVVTNPGGEQYIINQNKFESRYTMDADKYSLLNSGDVLTTSPQAVPTKCIRLTEDVTFTAPWGEEMHIKAGGVLVVGEGNDIYGIQPEEFADTYKPCDANGNFLDAKEKGFSLGADVTDAINKNRLAEIKHEEQTSKMRLSEIKMPETVKPSGPSLG